VKRWLVSLLGACASEQISLGAYESPHDAQVLSAPFPYFEAEDGELAGGFVRVSASDASGAAALAPPLGTSELEPGPARASYRFSVPSAGSYVVWGRIQAPGANNNRVWYQVDHGAWIKWRISTGDIWYWDDLHDDADYGTPVRFTLSAGEHTLTLANCVDGWRIDRFYVTSLGDTPPGNTTNCRPPHSIELNGECQPSCGAQNGQRCSEQDCAGKPLIAAYDCAICCSYP
jgi:hypothetical protein